MSAKSQKRQQAKWQGSSLLNEALERRMVLYVLAAGATLAGVPAAQAKVVFTPNRTKLHGRYDIFSVDLDNDGVTDFTLSITTYSSAVYQGRLTARGGLINSVGVVRPFAAQAFTLGAKIGSSILPARWGTMASAYAGKGYGYFANTSDRCLGVRFQINGQPHYGWIGFRQVITGPDNHVTAKLVGWAYETEARTPIVAGDKGPADSSSLGVMEPTSLELLAMGHTAIADRQRRIAG